MDKLVVKCFHHECTQWSSGVFYGDAWKVLGWQACAVALAIVWTGFWTFVTMMIIKLLVGIDVPPKAEVVGLDHWQTGDQAYDEVHNDVGFRAKKHVLLKRIACVSEIGWSSNGRKQSNEINNLIHKAMIISHYTGPNPHHMGKRRQAQTSPVFSSGLT